MYKKQKKANIFDDDDVQTVPTMPSKKETSRIVTKEESESEEEPKIYEITEDDEKDAAPSADQENASPNMTAQEEEEEAELPQVRERQDVKMGFTEKKFAHLPARESQLKEPPYPKSKNMSKKNRDMYIDVEDKDPVWLKDKGDHFFKRFDYNAALNAYTKALKEDNDFLSCRLNRAATFIKLRGFVAASDDCSDCIK